MLKTFSSPLDLQDYFGIIGSTTNDLDPKGFHLTTSQGFRFLPEPVTIAAVVAVTLPELGPDWSQLEEQLAVALEVASRQSSSLLMTELGCGKPGHDPKKLGDIVTSLLLSLYSTAFEEVVFVAGWQSAGGFFPCHSWMRRVEIFCVVAAAGVQNVQKFIVKTNTNVELLVVSSVRCKMQPPTVEFFFSSVSCQNDIITGFSTPNGSPVSYRTHAHFALEDLDI